MTVNLPAAITEPVEQFAALDSPSEWVQGLARSIFPTGSRRRDLASGRPLGHPLHPLLTDVVIGSWLAAGFLDVFGRASGRAARQLVKIGVLAAIPTALAGLSDWMDLEGEDRRIGAVHALGNVTALGLFGASWLARGRSGRRSGVLLSAAGMAVAGGSAWFGGHLAYRRGIGVNQTAFQKVSPKWQDVLDEGELGEDRLVGARLGDVDIVLVRRGQSVHGMLDTCAHLGCPLHKGKLEDDWIVCPCHGSAFALDGTVVRGPATGDQPALDARIRSGKVQVRRRGGRS
jgi:nitrite reductase/ring-hydroxylating ferredoxin subunit/uncharacterized membrane protein